MIEKWVATLENRLFLVPDLLPLPRNKPRLVALSSRGVHIEYAIDVQ